MYGVFTKSCRCFPIPVIFFADGYKQKKRPFGLFPFNQINLLIYHKLLNCCLRSIAQSNKVETRSERGEVHLDRILSHAHIHTSFVHFFSCCRYDHDLISCIGLRIERNSSCISCRIRTHRKLVRITNIVLITWTRFIQCGNGNCV